MALVELIERLRRHLVIEFAVPLPVHTVLVRAANEREEAADLLASYRALAQAAGYSDPGEALKAIPVKDAVIAAARKLPRATPAPGASSTIHDFKIAAHAVWGLDAALTELDALATPSPPITDEED